MTVSAALRELGVPLGLGRLSLKRVYKLDVSELRSVLQSASKRQIRDKQVWDALFYRVALLRQEFKPLDLAISVSALARIRRRDPGLVNYLLDEVRLKTHAFTPRDAALLYNGLAKLGHRDELLSRSLLPTLLRRTSEKTWWEDLALLAFSCARLGDPGRDLICDRIVGALAPRLESIRDGHALSLLSCAFALPRGVDAQQMRFGSDESGAEDDRGVYPEWSPTPVFAEMGTFDSPFDSVVEMRHTSFVELLLVQSQRNLRNFRSTDLLHLCLALATMERNGHNSIFPPRLLKQVETRLRELYFEFRPAQFVRLLELVEHLPELEKRCSRRLLDEAAYCVRELTPQSCLAILRVASRLGGHLPAQSAAAWRLAQQSSATTHSVAGSSKSLRTTLSTPEVCDAADLLAAIEPRVWEVREAMLVLLQGLQKRRQEPDPLLLARLLSAYGCAAVRDTHWFHICSRLCGPSDPVPLEQKSARDDHLVLSQHALACAVLGLARLHLPELLDQGNLFSRCATSLTDPELVADVLEGAAILDLLERRPRDLTPAALEPLISIMTSSPMDRKKRMRLFPYSEVAVSTCLPEIIVDWRADAEASASAYPSSSSAVRGSSQLGLGGLGADPFAVSVGKELGKFKNIGLETSVIVGPLCVPWAFSLEGLAAYLDSNPPPGLDSFAVASQRRLRRRALPWKAEGLAELSVADSSMQKAGAAAIWPGRLSPETHVLVDLLRDGDFYHASDTLRGGRQRARGQVLRAERRAEVRLLRQQGWLVVCIPEYRWTFPSGGTMKRETESAEPEVDAAAASHANKALVYELVAALDSDGS